MITGRIDLVFFIVLISGARVANLILKRGKQFEGAAVLKSVSFTAEKNQTIALIGSSGGGKSTILRCLNLLEQPTSGTFEIDGVKYDADHIIKDITRRVRSKSGMVFQNFNLFQHLTALQNVTLGLENTQNLSKPESKKRALEVLEQVGLSDKKDSYPAQLSGGQQQRVAIARSLALQPDILLMDEPTSALDPEMVGGILALIRKIIETTDITILIVTHEMQFAHDVADKIIFLADGVIEEQGTPEQIFEHPQSPKTKKFLESFSNN